MSVGTATIGAGWRQAADALARRITRRRRLGAVVSSLGLGLSVGAIFALVAAWTGSTPGIRLPWPWLGVGAASGVLLGLLRARRKPVAHRVDAAWALDRLAGAGERGLTAATVEGPRGAEAAFASPALIAPPHVRLLPPRGTAVLIGSLLLALVAAVAGVKRTEEALVARVAGDGGEAEAPGAGAGPAQEKAPAAESAEAAAKRAEADAGAADRVLSALGLSADERADPSELAARFTEREAREAARKAAGAGALGDEFDDPGASAEQMARLVVDAADGRRRATELRRFAAGSRALQPVRAVPPDRRAVVDRYYDRLRLSDEGREGDPK